MKIVKMTIVLLSLFLYSCSGGEDASKKFADQAAKNQAAEEEEEEEFFEDSGKGIGPVSELILGKIDEALVAEGNTLFDANCTACHKFSKMFVGPALQGVTSRRSPEWVMNMILNPEEMVEKDPVAKELYAEYLSPMANQNLKVAEARAILEYLRTKN